MVVFTHQEPIRFISKTVLSKIKIKKDYTSIVRKFFDEYNNQNIEGNSDIRSLLEQIGYKDYKIIEGKSLSIGKGRFDLALSMDNNSRYKTIIELKKTDSNEMIEFKTNKSDNLYKKALFQAIYYYLSDKNLTMYNKEDTEIKYLIITNYNSWYFIKTEDLNYLNELKKFPIIDNITTDEAYQKISNYLSTLTKENNLFEDDININYTSFHLKEIIEDNKKLELFIKFLSPQFLLDNIEIIDKNHITEKFYKELFYIIGLRVGKKKELLQTNDNFSFLALIQEKLPHYLEDDEKFDYAMELVLLWVNRVLFIQLYSSILVKYKILNKPILNSNTNYTFDNIEILFFNILNQKNNRPKVKSELNFNNIPYINSSLFQRAEIEERLNISISNLSSSYTVDIFPTTNIKKSKEFLKKQELNILEYLILFLNSYDIAVDDIFSDNSDNDLINASVLGMVFEKLNGYKDGSFFTSSHITEYMTKKTIEELIMSKFKKEGFEGENIKDIFENSRVKDKSKIESIFNSITICDIAVGSGHFLVSALNAMLLYKAQLGLYKNIDSNQLAIMDDMLVVKGIDEYDKESQDTNTHSIYKELYESKQKIISNSLFGVDINPKSVYISRLRLWIELLKHTYFTNNRELVLLPNIDINIKQGNSIISDFKIGENFDNLFDYDLFNKYKELIAIYKDPLNNRSNIQEQIDLIKTDLDENFNNKDKFEWRYEFPEILNNEGKFIGFDIILSNPPYIRHELLKETKPLLEKNYTLYESKADLYTYFYELSYNLLSSNGFMAIISSNKFCRADYGYNLRKFLKEKTVIVSIIDFEKQQQFKKATTDTIVLIANKNTDTNNHIQILDSDLKEKFITRQDLLKDSHYSFMDTDSDNLYNKITLKGKALKEWNVEIKRGILTGLNEAFVISQEQKEILTSKSKKNKEIIVPIIKGADIKKYKIDFKNEYLINSHNNPPINIENYIEIKEYLNLFKDKLQKRSDKGETIYNLRDCNFLSSFQEDKIIWQELTDKSNFVLDTNGYYTLAGTFIMTGTNLKYILATLNSKLIEWYFHLMANSSGTGTMQWKKTFVERIPIPEIDKKTQNSIMNLVAEILKPNNHRYSDLKNKIDMKLYEIYSLNQEEINIIENWHKEKFKSKKSTKRKTQGKLL